MRVGSSKCKMLLNEWISSKPNILLARKQLDEVGRFSYLGSCISDEVSSHILKARLAFVSLGRLWRRPDIWLSIKARVYTATAAVAR